MIASPPIIAVITGDISGSAKKPTKTWLSALKIVLAKYGAQPSDWEVYRGDSFQILLSAEKAMLCCLHLKSALIAVGVNVRLAVGIGNCMHHASSILESNGSAFQFSGSQFEILKKNELRFSSGIENLDEDLNLFCALALLTINDWTAITAKVVQAKIEQPQLNQMELAARLKKSQSNISATLRRAGYIEIMRLENRYRSKLSTLNK